MDQKIVKDCYVFGSPPVVSEGSVKELGGCVPGGDAVLELFGYPADIIKSFVQPWDPVTRLFTSSDPTYPLVGDLGQDGVTLYASGPNRILRPLVRSILLIAPTWPALRDEYLQTSDVKLQNVGRQIVLLPQETQYLSDRFITVSVAVPDVGAMAEMASEDLLPFLYEAFPLDEFSISFVPAALRSFIHHFWPAYTTALGGVTESSSELEKI